MVSEDIFSGGTMNFDASFIMTINGGVHTDTVTYISKKNKIIGAIFIMIKVKPLSLKKYISNTGAVYHINIESVSDDKCLDKFK